MRHQLYRGAVHGTPSGGCSLPTASLPRGSSPALLPGHAAGGEEADASVTSMSYALKFPLGEMYAAAPDAPNNPAPTFVTVVSSPPRT